MTKSKSTKRALLVSMISLVLCCAMLVGTTFAWFTDSVTTGKNTIVAGNLDVELYSRQYDKATEEYKYVPVDEETSLFDDDALWEPGHTEVVYLKVANIGTLALKYQLGINVVTETTGTNVNGDTFKFSDYIQFALIDGEKTFETGDEGRTAAITAAEAANPVKLSDLAVNENGVLYPEAKETKDNPSEKLVTLVVYMPETVGNEANYKTETTAPTITLGVTLVATQTPYESDSFDEKYDENAVYPVASAKQLTDALTNAESGDTVTVSTGNYALTTYIPAGVSLVGNGTEQTILIVDGSDTSISTLGDGYKITNTNTSISNATVKGVNITNSNSIEYSVIEVDTNSVVLDNLVVTGGGQLTWNASVLVKNSTEDGSFTISNSTVSGSFRGILVENNKGDVYVQSCDIDATYPINVNGGGDFGLYVTDSSLHGWTSYSAMTDGAHFTNTSFSKGTSGYDCVAAYGNTTFTDCTFDSDFVVFAQTTGFTFNFNKCTKNGTLLTAENFKTAFVGSYGGNNAYIDSDIWNKCTCYVNGVLVTPDQTLD